MGARGSKPVTPAQVEKMSPEQQRIAAQKVLAANASKAYKAGWWAPKSGNATLKNAKNAARLKLSQLELREKQRDLKDKIAEAKLDLEQAKDDFQTAKKDAATAGANQNSRNARNDAEDEVDRLEDKINGLEKELRKIRKFIIFKNKAYTRVIKPVKVALGAIALKVSDAAKTVGYFGYTAAAAAYNAGNDAIKRAHSAVLLAHLEHIKFICEYEIKNKKSYNTGKTINDTSMAEILLKATNEKIKDVKGFKDISDYTPTQATFISENYRRVRNGTPQGNGMGNSSEAKFFAALEAEQKRRRQNGIPLGNGMGNSAEGQFFGAINKKAKEEANGIAAIQQVSSGAKKQNLIPLNLGGGSRRSYRRHRGGRRHTRRGY